MSRWKQFEIDCTDYLNFRFGSYANFIHMGNSDSTTPDIFVATTTGNNFFIDAKLTPAQCGQFVLFPNTTTSTFEYSSGNDVPINKYASLIMNYMNRHFTYFCNAGTAGRDIEMPNGEVVFSNWVIETYRLKGARYFITNNFTIFPVECFRDYFEIKGKYRIKGSGSTDVGKKRASIIANYITNNFPISAVHIDGKHLYANSSQNLDKQRFAFDSNTYMFSNRDSYYEIRKLSKTYHPNVIFSIKRKGNLPGITDFEFISALQRL